MINLALPSGPCPVSNSCRSIKTLKMDESVKHSGERMPKKKNQLPHEGLIISHPGFVSTSSFDMCIFSHWSVSDMNEEKEVNRQSVG